MNYHKYIKELSENRFNDILSEFITYCYKVKHYNTVKTVQLANTLITIRK